MSSTTSISEGTAPQHTPGPWEAYNGHDRKLGSWAILGSQPIANRASEVICRTSDDTETDAANARLIAAAPALLAALEGLLEAFSTVEHAPAHYADDFRQASSAIAQAYGAAVTA